MTRESEEDQVQVAEGNKPVKFSEEASLGGVVSERKLLCTLGVKPIQNLEKELQFACGFDKLGFLCGYKFISSFPQAFGKKFFVIFVPKLKSHIMRQQARGRSSWYIWEWLSSTEVNVLSKDAALKKFGFDIDLFFNSDVFKDTVPKFLKLVKKALAQDVPQKLKAAEEAGKNPMSFKRYIRSIEDSFSTLEASKDGSSFNLGNSSDGKLKIYRASNSYELNHFDKKAAEEKKTKQKNEFLAWMAARNRKLAAQQQGAQQQAASTEGMAIQLQESVLDVPKPGLDPMVWQDTPESSKPILTVEAQQKLDRALTWIQDQYHFSNLSVYIIGSICSNSWSENSDIDLDFCAAGATEDDSDEDVVKEFGWAFKKNFIENYMEKFPEDSKIGTHPLEVYFNPNPFQCFMSDGCYNVLENKWEVGPELKREGFDPISEYYADAMKQVDRILKDIRTKIFEVYELAFVSKKSSDQKFRDETSKDIFEKLENISELYKTMKRVRSNFQKPCKSKEEALKRRKDRKQLVVDAAFKFLDKFGYVQIMKDLVKLYDDKNDGANLSQSYVVSQILTSIKANMSLDHLEDSDDHEFAKKIQEADGLDESVGDLVKVSVIAAMMAIPNLLPAAPLARELGKAKQAGKPVTVNSPVVKKAIANAAKDTTMIGEMSKTNVVNAIAQVLWREARGKSEGTAGRKAVASVILNRADSNPSNIVAVLKQKNAFSCLNGYSGGWTDKDYKWFVPASAIKDNVANKEIWDECNSIALNLVDKKFTSTIGNRNAYLNKATASKAAKDTWGKKCDLEIGSHHFGYLAEHDPKIVVPGTMTTWKKFNRRRKAVVVIVKSGDTLQKIARDNKTTVDKILALNKSITNKNKIKVGQKIRVA